MSKLILMSILFATVAIPMLAARGKDFDLALKRLVVYMVIAVIVYAILCVFVYPRLPE